MGTVQRIIRNFLFLSFSEVFSKFFLFISTVYLARVLGPDEFGVISFAMAILTYGAAFSALGLDLLGMREIAKNKLQVKQYVREIIPVKLFLSFVVFIGLAVALVFWDRSFQEKLIVVWFGASLFPLSLFFDWVFKGLEQMIWVGWARIIEILVYMVLVLLMIHGVFDVLFVPFIKFVSVMSAVVFFGWVFLKKYGRVDFALNLKNWLKTIRLGFPIGLYFILALVIYNMDVLMLGLMRSNEEVGYYNAAYKIIALFMALIGVYVNALFPVIAQYLKNSGERLPRLITKATELLLIMVVPVVFGGMALAERIITLCYGQRYVAAGGALTILLSALIFIAVNTIYAWGLLAANRQKKCVMIISVQVAVNLLLNLFLIPAYGILGAALATVCAEIVGLPLYFFEFRKIVPTALVRNLVRPFAGGVGMLAFLRVFSCQNLWVLIAGAAFCYVIILWITGAFRLKELKFIYDSLVQHRRPPGLFELEEEKF